MCGIVGVVSLEPGREIDANRLTRMRDTLAHRGPDGAGLQVDGPVGLGHRRLAIVDESGGHQPMMTDDGQVSVVFNGEIYNHAELRRELIGRGHHYRTRSDTETILHAYREWGDELPERLHGMFAFALWDRGRQRLVVARDRLGIKPLFFTHHQGELLFASEVKALRAAGVATRLDRAAVAEFLASRHTAGGRTFYAGIERLLPGQTLTWSVADGVAIRHYWRLPVVNPQPSLSFAEATRRVRTQLEAAVERHLMSDRPVGVLLSGGLDSSALAAIAARQMTTRLQTFSVGFNEREGDELAYAREVATALGSEHHDVRVTADEFFSALPHLVAMQDEPMAFSSGVPLYVVSQLAHRHVKVVLTGEGADELFLGYNRYRVTFWNERIGRPYHALVPDRVQEQVRASISKLPSRARRYAERSCLAMAPGHRAQFFDNFSVFSDRRLADLLMPSAAPAGDPYRYGLRCYAEAEGGSLERMAAVDLQTYLCELLTKQDRMSMAASIESRVPFLDDELVAQVCALPGSFKLRGWTTKAVLRAAVADLLPERILTRPKMGFPVPLARWFRGAYRGVVEEFVLSDRARARHLFNDAAVRQLVNEHLGGTADHGERLWLLVNFEIWQRLFIDREAAADIMRPVRDGRGATCADRVDQTWGVVAAQHGRSAPDVPDGARALTRPSSRPDHHPRAG